MDIINHKKKYYKTHFLVYSCQYHVIFCPKFRRNVLVDGIDVRLKELIIEHQEQYNYKVLEMEVMPNHVHLLLDVNPSQGVCSIVSKIKGMSSRILRQEFAILRSRLPCLWTRSKFISTVGSVSIETVKKYIEEQKGV